MKQFKDLDIIGPDEQFPILVDAVSKDLPAGWHRDSEAEDHVDWLGRTGTEAGFAFARDATEDDPAARLFLHRELGRLRVSNIVPRDPGKLSMRQYNEILDEFAEALRTHLPSNSELKMRVTSDEAAITDWLSGDAAGLLTRFSKLANMSTGASHPLDFERWARFLIQAHGEQSTLDSSFLSRWLVEELGWPEDRAHDLARDYEFARDLLKAYDDSR